MEQNELIELFEKNGLRRVDAKALALFRDGRQRSSMEIEREAGLHQPEVALAMPKMVGRGWFFAEHIKREGKGRPYIIYRPLKSYKEICADIAEEQGTKIATMMADMNALRTVA